MRTCDLCGHHIQAVFLSDASAGLGACLACCDTLGITILRALRYYQGAGDDPQVRAAERQAETKAKSYEQLAKAGFVKAT